MTFAERVFGITFVSDVSCCSVSLLCLKFIEMCYLSSWISFDHYNVIMTYTFPDYVVGETPAAMKYWDMRCDALTSTL